MRLDTLTKTELLRHIQCQSGLTELEQALVNCIDEEPDIDVVAELEDDACKMQSEIDDLDYKNSELNDTLSAIKDICGDLDKKEKERIEEIEEIIKETL